MNSDALESTLARAFAARASLVDPRHEAAFRLFNGFLEGYPDLVVDAYGRTVVLHNYAEPPEQAETLLRIAQSSIPTYLPWVQAIIVKTRNAPADEGRRGSVVYGSLVDRWVREEGVRYAIDLLLHQDTTLYLDTRNLRRWALRELAAKTVLNTFAYTGSLGVAALAGGASRVVQVDLQRAFLNVAKTSYTLNGFPVNKADFKAGDFWVVINQLKRSEERFDCVFVDPPLFAATAKGTVDMIANSHRVINKVRPLINDGGYLVAVNNALFVSGAAYLQTLQALCADGYLAIEEFVSVPSDITGYELTRVGSPPVDTAPFNHSTKIAILRVRRRQS